MRRLRGLVELTFDAVEETTGLVERTHAATAERWLRRVAFFEPLATPARALHATQRGGAATVYATIRAVSRGSRMLTRAGATATARAALGPRAEGWLEPPTPLRSDAARTLPWLLDQGEALLNGLVGDRLARRGRALDLGMSLRHRGRVLPLEPEAIAQAHPRATERIVLFVHGLACTEWVWSLGAERHHGDPGVHFGTLLEAELGYTPFFLRYNTGRHVSENGRALAELLGRLVAAYPRRVEEIALVGHSMGGLVARSAVHAARREGAAWLPRVRHVVCLGSPHLGAPLEKGTAALSALLRRFGAAAAQVPAALLEARSEGIRDLRFGYTLEEEWRESDPRAPLADRRRSPPPVAGVAYTVLATTLTRDPAHPLGWALGDLLVRLPSATGRARRPERRLRFHGLRVVGGLNHFELASHPAVYAALREGLEPSPPGARVPRAAGRARPEEP